MTRLKITAKFFTHIALTGLLMLASFACNPDEDVIIKNPDYDDINDVIRNLSYDASSLLNVQNINGGNSNRDVDSNMDYNTPPVNGKYAACKEVTYSLDKNFDGISVLRPTNGVIWPGALVFANNELLKGTPVPITLERAPMKLRLDLPGMGSNGTIEVEKPNNSDVQTSIDEALEWWNANAYQEGYTHPSLSHYETSESFSSQQLAMDVGLNAEWATSAVESQFSYASNTQKRVAVMVFKQVFYTITMDTPGSPAAVFGPNVTLSQVQTTFDERNPPAYISSVAYGRIVMFRLETTNMSKDINLNAVLEYAGGADITSTVNTTFDELLQNSSITVVTIGGDAEVASEAVSAKGPGSLKAILTGKNAAYRRDNPGVPIGYTINYLKDNSLAKMGYTTDYTITDCSEKDFVHRDIRIKNKFKIKNIRVKLTYINGNGTRIVTSWETVKDETFEGEYLPRVPAGAYDVKLNVEKFNLFDGWTHFSERNLGHVDRADEGCWVAYEKSGDEYFRKCVDEH